MQRQAWDGCGEGVEAELVVWIGRGRGAFYCTFSHWLTHQYEALNPSDARGEMIKCVLPRRRDCTIYSRILCTRLQHSRLRRGTNLLRREIYPPRSLEQGVDKLSGALDIPLLGRIFPSGPVHILRLWLDCCGI